jgi:hypothetical protein
MFDQIYQTNDNDNSLNLSQLNNFSQSNVSNNNQNQFSFQIKKMIQQVKMNVTNFLDNLTSIYKANGIYFRVK